MHVEIPISEIDTLPPEMRRESMSLAVRIKPTYIRIDAGIFNELVQQYKPTLSEKLRNFASELRNLTSMRLKAAQDIIDSRIKLCQDCPRYFDKETLTCMHNACGCKITRKALYTFTACPIGRWIQVGGTLPESSYSPQPHYDDSVPRQESEPSSSG